MKQARVGADGPEQLIQRRPLLLPAVVLALEPSPQGVVAEAPAPAQN